MGGERRPKDRVTLQLTLIGTKQRIEVIGVLTCYIVVHPHHYV
jgi:hypothetical protein